MLYIIIFSLSCLGTVFLKSDLFTDSQIIPKQYYGIFCLLLTGMCIAIEIIVKNKEWQKFKGSSIKIYGSILFITVTLQALYGIVQYLTIPQVGGLTGSFDNPAGFSACLCVGIPYATLLIRDKNKLIKSSSLIAVVLVVVAVSISKSRAGILSMALWMALILFDYIPLCLWRKTLLFTCLLMLLSVGLYFMKKDSADGRVLIWQCSVNIIMDKPIMGHGWNGFKANYMDYQAEYFSENPHSRYAMLADNIKHPFNEYIAIAVKFGFAGIVLLIIGIVFLGYCYSRNKNALSGKISLHSLMCLGVFALFSYPFTYSFVWIITLFNIYILVRNANFFNHISIPIRKVIWSLIAIACLFFIVKLMEKVSAEIKWKKISQLSQMGHTQEMLPHYAKLEKHMYNNAYFLYNYAAELYVAEHYKKSLILSMKCRNYWSDYDLEMLIGRLHYNLKQYKQAEAFFINASLMCPNRFYPLYYRMFLYKDLEDTKQVTCIARQIINKSEKTRSSIVKMIKEEAVTILNEMYDSKDELNKKVGFMYLK